MEAATIQCPNCDHEFEPTKQLIAPIIEKEKERLREGVEAERQSLKEKGEALQAQADVLKAQQDKFETELAQRVAAERDRLLSEAKVAAAEKVGVELRAKEEQIKALDDQLEASARKLGDAQRQQADLIREKRELAEQKQALALSVEKKVDERLAEVQAKAKEAAEDEFKLKLSDKERKEEALRRQIEELKRRIEQGSQQAQGETLELDVEDELRLIFPFDVFEPVGKGQRGGDVLQRVRNSNGREVGTILWETKRTKGWQDGWLSKLRSDRREINCDVAVLASQALPDGVRSFDLIDDIYVAGIAHVVPVAKVMRELLLNAALSKQVSEGQQSTQSLIYDYMMGGRFKDRMQAILEHYKDMSLDLDRERKLMTKQWSKRSQQIEQISDNIVGMIGDLEGIAGSALGDLSDIGLALPANDADDGDDQAEA